VVHQHLRCVHPHRSHWPWGHVLHRNRDRRDVVVRVSIPNTGIHRSSWSMEEGPTWGCLLNRCSFQIRRSCVPQGITYQLGASTRAGLRTILCRPSLPILARNPLRNVQVQEPEPWLKPKDLAIIRRANANDVRCVSWILRNITDPEALDAAIRLAGTIRWFDDGINVDILTVRLFLRSRRVLIPLGICILGQGTGRTTLGGRWCGSTPCEVQIREFAPRVPSLPRQTPRTRP
jgi:hypothetical protein